jgi:hypothetical protein
MTTGQDRVAERTVIGLHWHTFGAVPAPDVRLKVAFAPDPKRPGLIERTAGNLLNGRPWHSIAGGTFRYACARANEDQDQQAWLLWFYSAALVLVLLTKDDSQ